MPPLQPTQLSVIFGGGVDTKTDEKQVALTALVDLQNCTFTKTNTLAKRTGYIGLGRGIDGTTATYENATGLAKRDDELVLFADGKSYSYRPESSTWSTIGPVSSVVATDSPLARTGTDQTMTDAAQNGGVNALAWEDNRGGVWCSATDAATGRILLAATQLDANGTTPRCVAVGTVLFVLWVNGARIWLASINPALPAAAPVPVILTEDCLGTYDACVAGGGLYPSIAPGLIAWSVVSGGYRVGYLSPSGVLGSPVTGLPSTFQVTGDALGCIAVTLDKTNLSAVAVAWVDSTGLGSFNINYHAPTNLSSYTVNPQILTGGSGNPFVRCTVEYDDNSVSWWAVENSRAGEGAPALGPLVYGGQATSAPSSNQTMTVNGHGLVSRAFVDNGAVYCGLVYGVEYFPYVAITGIAATNVVARLEVGESTGLPTRDHVASCFALAPDANGLSRQHAVALGNRIQLSSSSGTVFGEQGLQLATMDFDHDLSFQTAELGKGLYLAGACPQHYDGQRWAEPDFHAAPDVYGSAGITITQSSSGNLTGGDTYNYVYWYEEIDAQGELHPGACSVQTLFALPSSGGQSTTHTIPTYRLTSKLRVRIGVARSAGNATGAPTAIRFYRVSSTDPTQLGAAFNGYLLNDPTVDSVTFIDGMSDAVLITKEPLYTNGGILSNDPYPIAGSCIAGGKSRLFWTDPDDPNLVRYSQELRDETACEASAFLSTRLDPLGGAIVAIAIQDDNVIVLKETAIYAFGGPGPDADGGLASTDAFTPPQLVTSDVGCSDASSVCQGPMGVYFKSQKGIYVLGRDLQVKRIGDPVFAYNDQRISRTTLIADLPHVLFLTDDGFTLLYDYDRDQWSKYTNHEGYDGILVDNVYYYLRTDGRVFMTRDDGVYADGTTRIPMLIETAWIKIAGYLQGWQKIWHALVLGEYESTHTLRMRYRLDYEPAYSAPLDIAADPLNTPDNYGSGTYGGGTYGGIAGAASVTYQRDYHLNKRCQAISFRFEDLEPAGAFGASFELSELLLTGGMVRSSFKVGAARQS